MNNKRGISQAFGAPSDHLDLRQARVFDVFGISRVLIRAIRDLCGPDHHDDPEKVALWSANKDPASVREWIASGADIWVGLRSGDIVAVGGLRTAGEITLLYVDPDHIGRGVGSALLRRMEQQLVEQGCVEAHLSATRTALTFYRAHGWRQASETTDWHDIRQFPMHKRLGPTG